MSGDFKLHEVWLQYCLVFPGGRTPDTKQKRWFFEVPSWFERQDDWLELLHRILYDANVVMRRRQPEDPAWLAVDQVRVGPVDTDAALAWDGKANLESGHRHLPWMVSEAQRVWEPGACFFVNAARAYQPLPAQAFSRLIALRERAAGRVADAALVAFLDKVHPGEGATRGARWETELDAVRTLLPTRAFRSQVGATESGPPRHR